MTVENWELEKLYGRPAPKNHRHRYRDGSTPFKTGLGRQGMDGVGGRRPNRY